MAKKILVGYGVIDQLASKFECTRDHASRILKGAVESELAYRLRESAINDFGGNYERPKKIKNDFL